MRTCGLAAGRVGRVPSGCRKTPMRTIRSICTILCLGVAARGIRQAGQPAGGRPRRRRNLPDVPRRRGRQGRRRQVDRRRRREVRGVGARRDEAQVHRLSRGRFAAEAAARGEARRRSTARAATRRPSRSTREPCTAWRERAAIPSPRPARTATARTTSSGRKGPIRARITPTSRPPAESATATTRSSPRASCPAATWRASSTTAFTARR